MSIWLRRSLALWIMGAVTIGLVWNERFVVGRAVAQTGPAAGLTPEQLAEAFGAYLVDLGTAVLTLTSREIYLTTFPQPMRNCWAGTDVSC